MKQLTLAVTCALLGMCATDQALTPEQLAQYQQVVHSAVTGALSDYKTIKQVQHK